MALQMKRVYALVIGHQSIMFFLLYICCVNKLVPK